MTDLLVVEINDKKIFLPEWLSRRAVDPRVRDDLCDDYWEMVASGSISLTPEQLDQALEIAEEVRILLAASS